jgi:hypothetical protein
LLLLTTPFGIVLQYFGSEQEIFSFNRNPKTFVLATIVLMLVLRLLTLSLEYGGALFKLICRKSSNRSTASSTSEGTQGEGHTVVEGDVTLLMRSDDVELDSVHRV